MALSYAGLIARINRDSGIILLGLTDADARADVIVDAVNEYVRHMDSPIISANLAVTEGSTGPYSIPATINKLRDIRDDSDIPLVYTVDPVRNKITLQNSPGADATYVVYGTTNDNRTNISTVVAAIAENNEDVLWAFIEAKALRWAKEETADNQLEYAKKLAMDSKRSRNRTLNMQYMSKLFSDERGQNIGDSSNAMGISTHINNLYEQDIE